jgi:hypothetical protein
MQEEEESVLRRSSLAAEATAPDSRPENRNDRDESI